VVERTDIRFRLQKHNLSYVWLISQLRLRGVVTDKTEMSSVISGARSGPKAERIIQTAAAVLDSYEQGSVLVTTG